MLSSLLHDLKRKAKEEVRQVEWTHPGPSPKLLSQPLPTKPALALCLCPWSLIVFLPVLIFSSGGQEQGHKGMSVFLRSASPSPLR